MTMRKWFVIHDGKVVEEVFFLEGMKAGDVRRALIGKDGFPEDIAVFAEIPQRKARGQRSPTKKGMAHE